ncbi:MAG: energy transducer TonB [Phaeodactylibacter sp.]|nr:energy transducer TonB [Phaeodactylibacter sp.]MCB9296381.1 energy transducer TonB [Lewinellaceae bacterium]
MKKAVLSTLFAAALISFTQAQPFSGSVVDRMNGHALASAPAGGAAETPQTPVYNPKATTRLPQFPGGEAGMQAFMARHLDYPRIANENGFEGTVMVQATIAANGSLADVRAISSPDPVLDAAAVQAVMAMPKWLPALQMGRAVKCRVNIPVSFTLD